MKETKQVIYGVLFIVIGSVLIGASQIKSEPQPPHHIKPIKLTKEEHKVLEGARKRSETEEEIETADPKIVEFPKKEKSPIKKSSKKVGVDDVIN